MPVTLRRNFDTDTDRRPSPNLWGDGQIFYDEIKRGLRGGVILESDFTDTGPITAVTTDADLVGLPFYGFNSSGGTHTYADVTGGVLVCTEATDNEASYVRTATQPFQISSNKNDFWAEWRIKVSAITDNQIGFIAGMWDNTAMTVIVPLSTTNPPVMATTGNFVGFWGPEEDAGSVDAIYKADGVTEVVVNAACHQFVADTYVKFGLKYKKNYKSTGVAKLSYYVNGIEQATTKTVPNNTGTDFPADVRLGFMFGHRLGASTSSLTSCDWFKIMQLD